MSSDSSVATAQPVAVTPRGGGRRWSAGLIALLGAVALTAACSQGPISPTLNAPVGTTTVTEVFSGTLPVGGYKYYSFSIAGAGAVTATLTNIGGAGVPPTVVVNLGVGQPGGITCLPSNSADVQVSGDASVTTLVTTNQSAPGVFCAIIKDTGNLFAPAQFTITIDHP